jgi:GAF domain-containing protein
MARVAPRIAPVVCADEAVISRVVGDRVRDVGDYGWTDLSHEYALADFPATAHVLRTRTPGQVVAGDPVSDPAEVALLRHGGFEVVLMVPLVFGGRDVGLLELYRRRAIPFSAGEVERAMLISHQLAAVLDLLERTGAAVG